MVRFGDGPLMVRRLASADEGWSAPSRDLKERWKKVPPERPTWSDEGYEGLEVLMWGDGVQANWRRYGGFGRWDEGNEISSI